MGPPVCRSDSSAAAIGVHHRRRGRHRRHYDHRRLRRGNHLRCCHGSYRPKSAVRSTNPRCVRRTMGPNRSCAQCKSATTHSCVRRSSPASSRRKRVPSYNLGWTNSHGCCRRKSRNDRRHKLQKPSTTGLHGTSSWRAAAGPRRLSPARNCCFATTPWSCSCHTADCWPSSRCGRWQSLPCCHSAGQSRHCCSAGAARCVTASRCWSRECSTLRLTADVRHCLPDCWAHCHEPELGTRLRRAQIRPLPGCYARRCSLR